MQTLSGQCRQCRLCSMQRLFMQTVPIANEVDANSSIQSRHNKYRASKHCLIYIEIGLISHIYSRSLSLFISRHYTVLFCASPYKVVEPYTYRAVAGAIIGLLRAAWKLFRLNSATGVSSSWSSSSHSVTKPLQWYTKWKASSLTAARQ